MAQHDVNNMRVEQAVAYLMRGMNGLPYSEALLASAEATGRLIVEVCSNPVQMMEMVQVVDDHIRRTISVGAQAKGFGVG